VNNEKYIGLDVHQATISVAVLARYSPAQTPKPPEQRGGSVFANRPQWRA